MSEQVGVGGGEAVCACVYEAMGCMTARAGWEKPS